jgi:tRNA-dihydrouridine synthase
MMEWTDRHWRFFLRLLSKRTVLYTEMVVDSTLKFSGKAEAYLRFNPEEHPVVCQLGGSNPEWLAEAAAWVDRAGYDGINLNCGCPSPRVAGRGAFGAALMFEPELVRDCVVAMRRALTRDIPITVKCRLGADKMDSYASFAHFLRVVSSGGCRHFIVHARKCLLKGLSPKDNRTIPPLRYHWVQRAALEFPHLQIGINGGVNSLNDAAALLLLRRSTPRPPLTAADFSALEPCEPASDAVLASAHGRRSSGAGGGGGSHERRHGNKRELREQRHRDNDAAAAGTLELGVKFSGEAESEDEAAYPSGAGGAGATPACCGAAEEEADAAAGCGDGPPRLSSGGSSSVSAAVAAAAGGSSSCAVSDGPAAGSVPPGAALGSDLFPKDPMLQLLAGLERRALPAPLGDPTGASADPATPSAAAVEEVSAARPRTSSEGGSAGDAAAAAAAGEAAPCVYPQHKPLRHEYSFRQHPGPGFAVLPTLLADESHTLLDGVMLGRAAYNSPWMFADADRVFFGERNPGLSRREVIAAYLEYCDRLATSVPAAELVDMAAHAYGTHILMKPLLNLFFGCVGGARWRSLLSAGVNAEKLPLREAVDRALAGAGLLDAALDERPPA